jgi:hypothetical protein
MIVVTMATFATAFLAVGGWFLYLRSQAIYHDREAQKFLIAVQAETGLPEIEAGQFSEWASDRVETSIIFEGRSIRAIPTADTRGYTHHKQLADSYWETFYYPLVVTQEFLARPVSR